MGDFVYLKPLDEHAHCHYVRHQMGFATELLIGGVLNTPFLKGNDHDAKLILIQATQHLFSQDRMLSVVPISEGEGKSYWAGIKDPLRMESLVAIDKCPRSFTNMSSRIEYVNSCYSSGQLDIEDKTTPLWKLVLNRGYNDNESDVLIIIISHMIGDGESTRRLFLEVLDFIHSDQKNGNLRDSISPDGTFPIQHSNTPPLSLEDVFNMRPPISEILSTIISAFMLSKYFPAWIYRVLPSDNVYYSRDNEKLQNFKPSPNLKTRVIILPSLYAVTKSPLLGSYISINSLLYIVLNATVFETSCHFNKSLDTIKDKTTINFVSNTVMKILSPNKRLQVQNFAGYVKYSQNYNVDTIFWDSVKKYHQYIHKEPRVNARFTMHLFKYAGGAAKMLSKLYYQSSNLMQHIAVTSLSNIGPVFTTDTCHEYENIDSSHISHAFVYHQPGPATLPASMYAISVDKMSEIAFTFSWRTDSISDEWVDYFEDVLCRSVKKLVSQVDKPELTMTIKNLTSSLP